MRRLPRSHPHPSAGSVAAGVAVALGFAAAVGLTMAGDGPDLQALARSAALSCSFGLNGSAAI